jgi:hypothetical protein
MDSIQKQTGDLIGFSSRRQTGETPQGLDEMEQLDALFIQNLPELELDSSRMWSKIQKRLEEYPQPVDWTQRFSQWLDQILVGSGELAFRLRPAALAACLVLLAFSTWFVHDQNASIEQWQVLIQIEKAWTGNATIHPATEENPFVLSEDNKSGTNPFNNLTS